MPWEKKSPRDYESTSTKLAKTSIGPSAEAVIRLKPEAGGSMLKETDTVTFASSFSPQASNCLYVSIYKSHATQDHGLRRRFF
jgi:hypothetical protein